jgi:hypothetical protein
MSKFVTMLNEVAEQKRPMVLIASLPRNDADLAKVALENGVDVVKIHINLHHHASNTHFGTLDEEKHSLERILKVSKDVPVGIVPFGSPIDDAVTYSILADMGFDFFSLYLGNAVVGCLPPPEKVARMLALSVSDPIALAAGLDSLPIQVCEMSIMEGDTYGQPFTYHDLLRYSTLRHLIKMPLVVPTQHIIKPESVRELAFARVEGLMIGAVIAGNTIESWRQSVIAFRKAIDQLK